MAKRRIDIEIRGRNRTSAAFRSAGRQAKGLGTQLHGVKAAALAAGAALGYTLVRGLGAALTGAIAFQRQMAMVNTMLSQQAEHLIPRYAREITSLMVSYGEATETLAKGAYDILSAGADVDKAMGLLRVGVRMAKGGMTETNVSIDALMTILNSYALDASEAEDVSDKLFMTVKKGRFFFDQLAGSIGNVSAMAANAGMDLDDLLAAIASMTHGGIRVEKAMTALRAVLGAIIDPSDKAKRAMSELGVKIDYTSLQTKGLVGILDDLKRATPQQLAAIFPKRGQVGISALLQDIEGVRKNVELMSESTGESDRAFNKMARTAETTFSRVGGAFKDLGKDIGAGLLYPIERFLDVLLPSIERVPKNMLVDVKALKAFEKRERQRGQERPPWAGRDALNEARGLWRKQQEINRQADLEGVRRGNEQTAREERERHQAVLRQMAEARSGGERGLEDILRMKAQLGGKDDIFALERHEIRQRMKGVREELTEAMRAAWSDPEALDKLRKAMSELPFLETFLLNKARKDIFKSDEEKEMRSQSRAGAFTSRFLQTGPGTWRGPEQQIADHTRATATDVKEIRKLTVEQVRIAREAAAQGVNIVPSMLN